MLLLSHPTGNQNVRAALEAFHRAGRLREFDTGFSWRETNPLAKWIPRRLARQLERRVFDGIPFELQHIHPFRELVRLATSRVPLLSRQENAPFSIYSVYRSLDRHVAARLPALARDGLQVVYTYEDCALSSFQVAKKIGLKCVYDLPIGYWRAARQIYEEERDLQPAWSCTLSGLWDSDAKLARKEMEIELADLIIVPSNFVRNTLLHNCTCSAPVSVVPFGSPPPLGVPATPPYGGPLRVLYVGSLGQRKGLSYLLDAIDQLGSTVELTLIGKPESPHCRPLADALQRYHWIPSLPHAEVLEQMRCHDVFVFPSLFEGFGLVLTEALSQGLPVIATPHTAAPELITDGVEGFIVPIRDSQAIFHRLDQLASNRQQLGLMRAACLRRSAQIPWLAYQNYLLETVLPLMS